MMAKNKLLVTTKAGVDMHYHVAFIDDDNGLYFTLPAKDGHVHTVTKIPAEEVPVDENGQPMLQPAEVDPETGEPLSAELVDPTTGNIYQQIEDGSFLIFDEEIQTFRPLEQGGIIIEPGSDNHVHEGFKNYERDLSKKAEKDDEIVADVFEFYKYAKENEAESLAKAKESYDFWKGKQWTPKLKQYLEGLDRACVTINKIPNVIDTFIGFLIENRQDVTYTPVEEGDSFAAEICSKVLKIIYAECNYPMVEVDVFTDEIIAGRGWFDIILDKDAHLEGKLKVVNRKWSTVKCLEHEARDLSDCEGLVKEDCYSFTKLKSLFPEKADEIQADFDNYLGGNYEGDDYQTKDRTNGDHYTRGGTFVLPKTLDDTKMVDVARKEFLVLTRWMKVYEKGKVFVFPEADYDYNLKGWKPADIKLLEEIPGAFVIEKNVQRIRITKTAGNTVLSDENVADLPTDDFYLVPAYAYFKDGEFWGKVESLKDPQRELNQRRSQIIDIGNRCSSYGYFYDADTFENPQDASTFLRTVSQPGAVWKVSDLNRRPIPTEGIKFPNELVQMAQMAEGTIDALGNINVEIDEGQSGEHLLQLKRHKLTSNALLFENFKMARKKVAELMLPLIYRYYSAERIYYMLTSDGQDLMGRPIAEYSIEDIQKAMDDTDPTCYNIQVVETEYSPTTRMAVQMILTKLAERGYPIPPESIISTIDMPASEKEKILSNIEASNQSQSQSAQAQVDGEVEKTLIGQGIIPQSVQDRMQLDTAKTVEYYRGGQIEQGAMEELPVPEEEVILAMEQNGQ